jgi:two-component system, LuxR family, sensor kinase FixL
VARLNLYLVVTMLWLLGGNVMAVAAKRVLLLNSFSRDVAPFSAVAAACRTTLVRDLGEPVELLEVSLDMAWFGLPEMESATAEYLEAHLKPRPVDLVVSIGAPALQFITKYREQLFPDTPLVVTGTEPRLVRPELLRANATMTGQNLNLPGLVEDMLRLRPDTTNLLVVLGHTPLEQLWVAECQRAFAAFTNRVTFTYLHERTLEEMEQLIRTVPPRSFILYGLLLMDAAGVPYQRDEGLRRLRAIGTAPIYSPYRSHFGAGIVGGHLMQDSDVGVAAARAGIRILRGERPETIPPQVLPPPPPIYDARELKHWAISEARLPADSRVEFRQPSFWERNRWLMLGGGAFILAQSGLIIGLVMNRAKRREAEAIATLIAELSSRFINLPSEQVDAVIRDAQRRVCESLGLDLSSLWQFPTHRANAWVLTHIHTPPNFPPVPPDMDAQQNFPWCLEKVRRNEPVVVGRVTEAPAEAARDRIGWLHFGLKSVLTLPLSVGSVPTFGALNFSTMRTEINWPPHLVTKLQLVAQIFANALARKRAEQALVESEERLSLAADSAEAGLWVLDCTTRIFWATEKTRAIFGYAPEEVISLERFEAKIHPEDRAQVRHAIDQALHHRQPIRVEYRVVLNEGRIKWIASQGRPHFTSVGEPDRLTGVSIDATARKQAEEKWRLTIEAMPSGLVLVNEHGQIVLVNEQVEKIFGWKRDELLGLRVETLLPARFQQRHPGHRAEFMHQPHARMMGVGRELYARRRDGSEFPVEVGLNPIHTEEGLLTLCAVVDISQRRQMEKEAEELRRELAHTGRVSLLGQLASALAHELSQPLGAILRNAEAAEVLLQQTPLDQEELRAIIEDIGNDDRRAGNVIDRLRSLLKRRVLELQPVQVPDLITEALALVRSDAAARQVQLDFLPAADLPAARGDRVHLQQVLLNLIINAMDAMNGTTLPVRRITISVRQLTPEFLEVSVGDTGPGIAPEALGQLFEPFYTTKAQGMGMGLAVSKTIIEAHQGRIHAENRPEGGALFGFTVPVAPGGMTA